MIDLLIRLQEKITELIKERQNRKRRFFEEFYRDIYENLISVHHDYLVGLNEIRKQIRTNPPPTQSEIMYFIEKKRAKHKGIRDHIETTNKAISSVYGNENFSQTETDFLKCIDVYLRSYFEGYTAFSGLMRILEELEHESSQGNNLGYVIDNNGTTTIQSHMLQEIGQTQRWLEKQFSDTALTYNTLRLVTFNETKNV